MRIEKFFVVIVLIYSNPACAQNFIKDSSTIIDDEIDYLTNRNEGGTKAIMTQEKIKPSVHICCQPGLYYKSQKCFESEQPAPAPEFPIIYTAHLKISNITVQDFQQIYHNPCLRGIYALDPEKDKFYFLDNGTIKKENTNELLLSNQYCLATILRNNHSGTIAAECINTIDPDPLVSTDVFTIHAIGCFISSVFSAATLFVYVVVRELQNRYGLVLRTYVGILMVSQVALGFNQLLPEQIYAVKPLCKAMDNRSTTTKNDSKQACGKNEYFSDCGSTCEKNCDDINNDDHSSKERCVGAAVCLEKCICKDGYVRDNGNNGKCIRLQECPRVKH